MASPLGDARHDDKWAVVDQRIDQFHHHQPTVRICGRNVPRTVGSQIPVGFSPILDVGRVIWPQRLGREVSRENVALAESERHASHPPGVYRKGMYSSLDTEMRGVDTEMRRVVGKLCVSL